MRAKRTAIRLLLAGSALFTWIGCASQSASTSLSAPAIASWLGEAREGCEKPRCRSVHVQATGRNEVTACENAKRKAREALAETIRVRIKSLTVDNTAEVNDRFYSQIRSHLTISTDVVLEDSEVDCLPAGPSYAHGFAKVDLGPQIERLVTLTGDAWEKSSRALAAANQESAVPALRHLQDAVIYGSIADDYRLQLLEIAPEKAKRFDRVWETMTTAGHRLESTAQDCTIENRLGDRRWAAAGSRVVFRVRCLDARRNQYVNATGYVVSWSSSQPLGFGGGGPAPATVDADGLVQLDLRRAPSAVEKGEVSVTARIDWEATFSGFSSDPIRARIKMLAEQMPAVEARARLYVPSGEPFVDYFRRAFCQGEGTRRRESYRLAVSDPEGKDRGPLVDHVRQRVVEALRKAPCRKFRLQLGPKPSARAAPPTIRVRAAHPINGHLPVTVTVGSRVPPGQLRLSDARALCLAACSARSWQTATRHCDRVAHLESREPSAYCLIESHVYQREYARAETLAERLYRAGAERDPKLTAWYGIIKMHTGSADAWALLDQVRSSDAVQDHALYWLNVALADLTRARGDRGKSVHRRNACLAFSRYLELRPGAPEDHRKLIREQGCIVDH